MLENRLGPSLLNLSVSSHAKSRIPHTFRIQYEGNELISEGPLLILKIFSSDYIALWDQKAPPLEFYEYHATLLIFFSHQNVSFHNEFIWRFFSNIIQRFKLYLPIKVLFVYHKTVLLLGWLSLDILPGALVDCKVLLISCGRKRILKWMIHLAAMITMKHTGFTD